MTRGVNKKAVFTWTDPTDGVEVIPTQTTDGQDGYGIRTWQHWGVTIKNKTDRDVVYRVLGYTFEDTSLTDPVELKTGTATSAAETAYEKDRTPGIATLQVEIDPDADTTGDLTVVFGTLAEG